MKRVAESESDDGGDGGRRSKRGLGGKAKARRGGAGSIRGSEDAVPSSGSAHPGKRKRGGSKGRATRATAATTSSTSSRAGRQVSDDEEDADEAGGSDSSYGAGPEVDSGTDEEDVAADAALEDAADLVPTFHDDPDERDLELPADGANAATQRPASAPAHLPSTSTSTGATATSAQPLPVSDPQLTPAQLAEVAQDEAADHMAALEAAEAAKKASRAQDNRQWRSKAVRIKEELKAAQRRALDTHGGADGCDYYQGLAEGLTAGGFIGPNSILQPPGAWSSSIAKEAFSFPFIPTRPIGPQCDRLSPGAFILKVIGDEAFALLLHSTNDRLSECLTIARALIRALDVAISNSISITQHYWAPEKQHFSSRLFLEKAVGELLADYGGTIPPNLVHLRQGNGHKYKDRRNIADTNDHKPVKKQDTKANKCWYCHQSVARQCFACPSMPHLCVHCSKLWHHEMSVKAATADSNIPMPPPLRREDMPPTQIRKMDLRKRILELKATGLSTTKARESLKVRKSADAETEEKEEEELSFQAPVIDATPDVQFGPQH